MESAADRPAECHAPPKVHPATRALRLYSLPRFPYVEAFRAEAPCALGEPYCLFH
jgi:hypothetical protein